MSVPLFEVDKAALLMSSIQKSDPAHVQLAAAACPELLSHGSAGAIMASIGEHAGILEKTV